MSWLDVGIVIVLAAGIIRGIDLGFVRQLFSAVGFFGGLFLGAWAETYLLHMSSSASSRALLSFGIIIGCGLVCLTIAEVIANVIKSHITIRILDRVDRWAGSIVASVAILGVMWLGASIFTNTPFPTLQRQIRNSFIISQLNSAMPPAPDVISQIGHLITPNGFPRVFTGSEPTPVRDVPVPEMGEMTAAIAKAKASTVKIEGEGCGGVVFGSGFVAQTDLVITNAHVVAGVEKPKVVDTKGAHDATVIWFNPNLDFAVLRVHGLAGEPLALVDKTLDDGTQGVVLGYPGGGDFSATTAAIIDSFTAQGRNIYNQDTAVREIYSMNANVISGNSGGPLVNKDGAVMGVVFANSVSYQHVGYALTMPQVMDQLSQADRHRNRVSTGSCAQ